MEQTQRWERPLDFPPGFWKRQLPKKYLDIASRGDIDAVRSLLAEHPEFLNKRGSHNRTLLWEAARRGKLALVHWLVEQGADVDALGSYNSESYVQITPYCAAIHYRRAEVADYLRPLSAASDIFRAAFLGDQAAVNRALDADHTLLNAEDSHDPTYFVPLIAFAVAGGQASVLDNLLSRGAIVAPYTAQLIYLAARLSRLDLIDLLVTHGTDLRLAEAATFVPTADVQVIRYLFDHGLRADMIGRNGFSPVAYLSRGDKGEHPDKIQLLLDYGVDVNTPASNGKTALHYAATSGHLRVMAVLLAHGADVALRDQKGETALSLARAAGKDAAAALLLQHGARR